MSENNKCAGKARESWTAGRTDPTYILTDDGAGLMLRISGAAYRNLKRIAEAMNRTSERMGKPENADNTPFSVFLYFELDIIRYDSREAAREAAFLICDGIDESSEFKAELLKEMRAITFENCAEMGSES